VDKTLLVSICVIDETTHRLVNVRGGMGWSETCVVSMNEFVSVEMRHVLLELQWVSRLATLDCSKFGSQKLGLKPLRDPKIINCLFHQKRCLL
jgi:hypothetical protein